MKVSESRWRRKMSSESGALKFLGLARKADKVKCGDDAVFAAADAGKARVIVTAADTGENTLRKVRFNLPPGTVHIELPFSKAELGPALGSKELALAVITEHGFAAAFVKKLSEEFPGRYEKELERLEQKAEKVLRRRREKAAQKNNTKQPYGVSGNTTAKEENA